MRLGIVVFLLPFTFVYDPDLLLIGDNMGQATLHISTCALGIAFWGWRATSVNGSVSCRTPC